MKTKLTLIWLVLIVALTQIGNRAYARGLHSARLGLHSVHAKKNLLFQTAARDKLGPGEQLAVNQQLTSPNGRFFLIMQGDGNLVLYQKDVGPLWATNTVNSGAARAVLQTDGEFVLYNASNVPIWRDRDVTGSATLQLKNDGSFVKVLTNNGEVRKWLAYIGPIALRPNDQLGVDESLLSAYGQFRLLMQSDGNLVLYHSSVGPLWATGTVGSGAVRAIMQSDGNLVLYRADNTPVWATNTVGQEATLLLGTDGNLSIIRNVDKQVVWSTNTAQATLRSNKILDLDQKLTSRNGKYFLLMQRDGNLVLYQKDVGSLWATGTAGSGATYAYNDGRLKLSKPGGEHVWLSPSFGGSATLKLQDDGNLVAIRDSDGVVVWSTNTGIQTPTRNPPTPDAKLAFGSYYNFFGDYYCAGYPLTYRAQIKNIGGQTSQRGRFTLRVVVTDSSGRTVTSDPVPLDGISPGQPVERGFPLASGFPNPDTYTYYGVIYDGLTLLYTSFGQTLTIKPIWQC